MRLSFRLAVRQSARTWRQALLIVLLILIPAAAVMGVGVVLASNQATPAETARIYLGQMQGRIHVVSPPDATLRQPLVAVGNSYDAASDENGPTGYSPDAKTTTPSAVLPTGTVLIPLAATTVSAKTATGIGTVDAIAGSVSDPAFAGRLDVLSGRAPTAHDEVALSPTALARFGVSVGDSISLTAPARTLRVTGVMRDATDTASADRLFGTAAALSANPSTPDPALLSGEAVSYYVPDLALDAATVRALNANGMIVLSRALVLDPPPDAVASGEFLADSFSGSDDSYLLTITLAVAAIGAFEVGLLAGAAFTVAARSAARSLAIISSVGAPRRTVIGIVSAQGIVLGLVSGVIGAGAGIGAAALGIHLFGDGSATQFPGLHVPWTFLVGTIVYATVVGWLAALVPAVAASRMDVVRALRGARKPSRPSRIAPIVGVILLAGGTIVAVSAARIISAATPNYEHIHPTLRLAGQALAILALALLVVGAVLVMPLLATGGARLIGRGTLAARLAGRDIARNRGRNVPVIASVLAVSAVASFAVSAIATGQYQEQVGWRAAASAGSAIVYLSSNDHLPSDPEIAQAKASIAAAIPGATSVVISTGVGIDDKPNEKGTAYTLRSPLTAVTFPEANLCPSSVERFTKAWYDDSRCAAYVEFSSAQRDIVVAEPDELAAILGTPVDGAARQALAAGKPVALDPAVLDDGTLTLTAYPAKYGGRYNDQGLPVLAGGGTAHAWADTPLLHTPSPSLYLAAVTPKTAADLGIATTKTYLAVSTPTGLTQGDLDAVEQVLAASFASTSAMSPYGGTWQPLRQDPPDHTAVMWALSGAFALVVLAVTAIALALARSDGRADELTLAAVGASPLIRRRIAFWQAAFVTSLGSILGALIGLVPSAVFGAAQTEASLVVPLGQCAAIAIGTPLIASALAFLTTRGRLRSTRSVVIA